MNYEYKSYFNTTPIGVELMKKCKTGAIKQEEIITVIFRQSQKMLTPSDILFLYPKNVPITSIRRAMTQLTKKGILDRSGQTKESQWGRPEHYWSHSIYRHTFLEKL